MKKVVLLLVCGLVLVVAGSAFAKSEWAKYNMNPVPVDGSVQVPQSAIDADGYLNCCFCHGPDVKHAGPKLPYCAEEE